MKSDTARIKTLLNLMIKSQGDKEFLIENFYNEILEELKLVTFVAPDNLKNYDKVYKDFIVATMKNFLYEQSEENKETVLETINFLQSFKVIGE